MGRQEMIEDLQSVAEVVDGVPTMDDIDRHGDHDPWDIVDEYGSWTDALIAADIDFHVSRTSDDVFLKELQRLADELGKAPTGDEMNEQGAYSHSTYQNRFGSWGRALELADVSDSDEGPTREDLLDEIKRLADELDRTPRTRDMRSEGKFPLSIYRDEFGSWTDAVREAGFQPARGGRSRRISEEDLIEELQRLAEETDGPVTSIYVDKEGEYAPSTYRGRFGSWAAALEAAGLDSSHINSAVSDEELIEELQRLDDELDKIVSPDDMDEYGEYASTTYQRRFGSWRKAKEEAGVEAARTASRIPEEELIEELQRLADEVEGTPTMVQMREEGKFDPEPYLNRWGQWSKAVKQAGLEPN